jgi:membrane fusion protein, multidrug efflux system
VAPSLSKTCPHAEFASGGAHPATRPRHLVALAPVLVALGVLALASACTRQAPAPEPIRSVRTQVVGLGSVVVAQEFSAEVRARTESRLSFRVPGRLSKRQAEVGQVVRLGEVLAQLDPTDLKLGQDSAKAAVQVAQANADFGEAEILRYRALRDQGFISGLELERREAARLAQRAQLSQAQAQSAVQGNQAGYATLTAPVAGVVTAVEAEPGAVLAAGTPILRLAHEGPRDAVFAVPEDQVAAWISIKGVGGALQVRPWGGAKTVPATVREVAAAADSATRTFQVKAEMAPSDAKLGQTLTVRLERPAPTDVILLPLSAVTQQKGQAAVWLLDRTTLVVQPQVVELAGAQGNLVVVAQGLKPGQEVVTAGVHTLTAGQKVTRYTEPNGPPLPPVPAVSSAAAVPPPPMAATAASR